MRMAVLIAVIMVVVVVKFVIVVMILAVVMPIMVVMVAHECLASLAACPSPTAGVLSWALNPG
jgi:hypothetical protein